MENGLEIPKKLKLTLKVKRVSNRVQNKRNYFQKKSKLV